jgi:ribonucleoside-diphosphate reductase alpha chain
VRVTNTYLDAVENDGTWSLINRTTGAVAKTLRARDLWDEISYSAWASADPGIQFDTTINEWHTCPVDGRINASNPCSEYMFLDDTACNLASFNLKYFWDETKHEFLVENFRHAVRLVDRHARDFRAHGAVPQQTRRAQELSVPHSRTRLREPRFLLMVAGVPYDSEKGTRCRRGNHRGDDRRILRHLRRDGRRPRTLPALRIEPRPHAARDPQSPPRRLDALPITSTKA